MADPVQLHGLLTQGLAFQQNGQLEQAQTLYRQVLKKDPRNFDALHLLGVIAAQNRDYAESAKLIGRAISVNPNNATAHYNRGIALDELRQYEGAITSYDKAIALKPDHAVAYNNRGICLHSLGRQAEAVASFDKAIALAPDYAEAHHNRGYALNELARVDEAIAAFEKALRLRPDYPFLRGTLIHTKLRLCDWRSFGENIAALKKEIEQDAPATIAWPALSLIDDPALQNKAVSLWANTTYPANPSLGPISRPRKRSGKLRIGYFSMDFREHPVAYLTARMFELHDRSSFEIYAFSYGPDTRDSMQQRLVKAFDEFIDVRDKSDQHVAALARAKGIDIAVDLAGYTTAARPGIMAARAAPVQVSFLGYAGSMAVPYMDYIIADRHVLPETQRHHFTEHVASLPWYMPTDSTSPISEQNYTRAEVGLPAEGFVFCSFNANQKILPTTFDIWMRILRQVEGSVLWLPDTAANANLRREAQDRGISSDRLVFARRMPTVADHLARERLADLFLDTLPFNAHTTAIDALWAGVPVLTCRGGSFAGRVATSALEAIGLTELVTSTLDDYETLAIALAKDAARLKVLRAQLSTARATAPLFDNAAFTRNIEEAYRQMAARSDQNLPPDHITIT